MNELIIPIGSGDFAVVRSDDKSPGAKPAQGGEIHCNTKPRTDGRVTVHPNPGNLGTVAQEKR